MCDSHECVCVSVWRRFARSTAACAASNALLAHSGIQPPSPCNECCVLSVCRSPRYASFFVFAQMVMVLVNSDGGGRRRRWMTPLNDYFNPSPRSYFASWRDNYRISLTLSLALSSLYVTLVFRTFFDAHSIWFPIWRSYFVFLAWRLACKA